LISFNRSRTSRWMSRLPHFRPPRTYIWWTSQTRQLVFRCLSRHTHIRWPPICPSPHRKYAPLSFPKINLFSEQCIRLPIDASISLFGYWIMVNHSSSWYCSRSGSFYHKSFQW
jgi:hypothetical protein